MSLAASALATVEVTRATTLANPSPEVRAEVERLLDSCLLMGVSDAILTDAAALTSASIRSLDAVHLASAMRLDPDEFVVYDRRLAAAARTIGISVVSPGT